MRLFDTILQFIPGDWGEEICSETSTCKVSCIRGADIVPIENVDFGHIPTRYISQQSYETKCLQAGDIVVEKSGGSPTQSTGRVVFISQGLIDSVGPVVCSNFCCAFRVKQNWYPLYVFYYLKYMYNCGVFFNFEGKTSGIKNLQLEAAYKAIPIGEIDKSRQIDIVDSLDKIQQKLNLNREINQNLEALAKQLYEYWFVQFDFPDENGRPYKSSGGEMVYNEKLKIDIPYGWEKTTLGELCHMYQPQTIGTNLLIPDGKYRVYGANGIVGRYNRFNHEKSEIAMACRGNSCGVLNRTMPFSWITGNAMVIQMKDETIHNEFINQALAYMNVAGAITGSGQPQLTRENLNSIKCVKPLKSVLHAFSQLIKPIVDHQIKIKEEIDNLNKLRDGILPLLMNGQVTIKE